MSSMPGLAQSWFSMCEASDVYKFYVDIEYWSGKGYLPRGIRQMIFQQLLVYSNF